MFLHCSVVSDDMWGVECEDASNNGVGALQQLGECKSD